MMLSLPFLWYRSALLNVMSLFIMMLGSSDRALLSSSFASHWLLVSTCGPIQLAAVAHANQYRCFSLTHSHEERRGGDEPTIESPQIRVCVVCACMYVRDKPHLGHKPWDKFHYANCPGGCVATVTSLSGWDGCGDKGARLGCHHNQ